MIRVYVAAAYGRQQEALKLANQLKELGYEITSRWLIQEDSKKLAKASHKGRERLLKKFGYNDIDDVVNADILVRLSDAEAMGFPLADSKLVSGARHFEHGIAWYLGKRTIVVGGKQHIFDRLDGVEHVENTQELLKLLGGESA